MVIKMITKFDHDLMSKPNLCINCKRDSSQRILCDFTRDDQREESTFRCYSYEKQVCK
jgi:hypothetical protein